MATLSSAGIGSGLDISSIVQALVEAETVPAASRLNRREADIQAEISAYGSVKSALSGFQAALSSLQELSGFQARSASVSDTSYFTATATTDAAVSNYNIEVSNLAKAQSLASGSFADADTVVGTGTLTFTFGTYDGGGPSFTDNPDKTSTDIVIDSSNNTLAGIRDAINAADFGVNATIINDGSGSRIVFSSEDTGLKNGLKITISGDGDLSDTDDAGLSQLAYDPLASVGSGKNLTETIAPEDASIIINGLTVTSDSNTITDSIDGITINLLKEEIGKTTTLNVSLNKAAVTGKINSFIAEYNEANEVLNALTSYNAETGVAGLLQGDAGVRTIQFQLRSMISSPVDNLSGSITSLVDIGIKTNENGQLTLDSTILNNALDTNFDQVGRVFAHGGFTSDNQIAVNSVDSDVPTGTYAINLSAFNPATSTLEGTIGGIAATATDDGKTLQGTGSLLGLDLDVLGGSTGDRGTVTIFSGIAAQLDKLLESYLESDGTIDSRTTSLNDRLSDINDEREALSLRSERIEARYLKQFIALDTLLSQLQTTSQFLTQQLANLPKPRSSSSNN